MNAIYAIRCKANGKMYIGKTDSNRIATRINEHIHALENGTHRIAPFLADFKKYGKDQFEFYVLEIYEHENFKRYWARDNYREYEWMRNYRTTEDAYGYNIEDSIAKGHIRALEQLIDYVEGLPPMAGE